MSACSCRSAWCSHCGRGRTARNTQSGGDYGIIGPLILIFFVVALVGFWPVMVWHGYGGPTGNDWRWDIHSTIAEGVYVGCAAFILFLVALGNRPAKIAPPRTVSDLRPPPPSVCVPAPPVCLHRNAFKVDSAFDRTLIYRCWCPDCESELPANWTRWCCGSQPEAPHMYNCPHAAR